MNPGMTEEAGETARSFMDIMREQPLSLALVVMNLVLLGFLFYSGSAQLKQRKETVDLIVKWQQESDRLMASCGVTKEVLQIVLDALARGSAPPSPITPKLQSHDPAAAPFVLPP